MSSDLPSAEEAARKAREIAAKLLGKAPQTTTTSTAATTTESSSGNSGSKRKRWGVAPAETASTTTTAAAAAAVSLPGMDILTKKLKQESEPVQLRLWITNVTKERPAWHYVTYMSPKLPLLIARARDENPAHKDEQLEVTFKGRGSSRQAPLPGIPEVGDFQCEKSRRIAEFCKGSVFKFRLLRFCLQMHCTDCYNSLFFFSNDLYLGTSPLFCGGNTSSG